MTTFTILSVVFAFIKKNYKMRELDMQKAVAIVEALEELTDISAIKLTNELIGVCWDEEGASKIREELHK